eukprot:3047318-Rhodomonas_salina.2
MVGSREREDGGACEQRQGKTERKKEQANEDRVKERGQGMEGGTEHTALQRGHALHILVQALIAFARDVRGRGAWPEHHSLRVLAVQTDDEASVVAHGCPQAAKRVLLHDG